MIVLINKGKREWRFEAGKHAKVLMPGEKREVEAATAKKYAKAYPKEFDIYEPAAIKVEAPEIVISDKVKAMIKGVKGLGVKSAVQLFIETEALTEEEQIKVVEDYEEEA